jgi:hypothetical protein
MINLPKETFRELGFFLSKLRFNLSNSRRDMNYLRFIPLNFMYVFGKLSYYRKASHNPELMEMILKANWLEE